MNSKMTLEEANKLIDQAEELIGYKLSYNKRKLAQVMLMYEQVYVCIPRRLGCGIK